MHSKGCSASIGAYSGTSCTNIACSAGTTDAAGTTGSAGNYGTAGVTGTHGTTKKLMFYHLKTWHYKS